MSFVVLITEQCVPRIVTVPFSLPRDASAVKRLLTSAAESLTSGDPATVRTSVTDNCFTICVTRLLAPTDITFCCCYCCLCATQHSWQVSTLNLLTAVANQTQNSSYQTFKIIQIRGYMLHLCSAAPVTVAVLISLSLTTGK